jgi:hypothetical protein
VKIHLLSDVHLERGPYTLPPDLDFDVLVAAGDISDNPKQAIDFLRSIDKPVVMILGNHDYWYGTMHGLFGASDDAGSVDMANRLAEFKRLATGTSIHVLEQESVVLEANGKRVRFLGATLWTSYGNGNQALMEIGGRSMNDTVMIGVDSWLASTKKNAKTYQRWLGDNFRNHPNRRNRFEPPVALDIHTRTVAWLERQLKRKGDWDSTVVVSHHWPSWDALVTFGKVRLPELSLDPEYWTKHTFRPDREENGVNRLASYGSPMEKFIQRYRDKIDLWCCGHVHVGLDMGLHGVRLACNPRGYAYSDGENIGNGIDFDDRKLINLDDGVTPALVPDINRAAKEIDALIDELGLLEKYVYDDTDTFLLEVVRARFDACANEINTIANRITAHINENLTPGFSAVIRPTDLFVHWATELYPEFGGDVAGKCIKAARRFLYRLRRFPRKPAQFARIQACAVARAVERLEARGVRVRVEKARRQMPFEPMTLHVDDAKGLGITEIWKVIDPVRGMHIGPGGLFWVLGV